MRYNYVSHFGVNDSDASVIESSRATAYLVVCPLDRGNIHVVGGGAHIFILLVGEDVDTNQVNLQHKLLFTAL